MKTKVLLIILVLFGTFSFAQRKVADKFFNRFAYIKATELYKDAVKKGNDSEHVLTRLGDCYYFNSVKFIFIKKLLACTYCTFVVPVIYSSLP